MNLDLGRVAAVHPEDNSVDLVMVADGARLAGVQVLSSQASRNTGLSDLPEPDLPASGDKWDRMQPTERDLYAVVAYYGRHPVVTGFLFPQVCQMLFKRKNFRVERHASDVYETVDDAGNREWHHPSGTFLRVAEDPEHEDLTGKDFDAKWAIARNTTRAPWLSVMLKAAGVEKMRLRVDPSGNVTLVHSGNLSVQTAGTASIASTGAMTLTAASLTVAAPTNFTGETLTHRGTNVGDTHVHGGVQAGGATTAGPA